VARFYITQIINNNDYNDNNSDNNLSSSSVHHQLISIIIIIRLSHKIKRRLNLATQSSTVWNHSKVYQVLRSGWREIRSWR